MTTFLLATAILAASLWLLRRISARTLNPNNFKPSTLPTLNFVEPLETNLSSPPPLSEDPVFTFNSPPTSPLKDQSINTSLTESPPETRPSSSKPNRLRRPPPTLEELEAQRQRGKQEIAKLLNEIRAKWPLPIPNAFRGYTLPACTSKTRSPWPLQILIAFRGYLLPDCKSKAHTCQPKSQPQTLQRTPPIQAPTSPQAIATQLARRILLLPLHLLQQTCSWCRQAPLTFKSWRNRRAA